jgi:hypothetical protein
VDRVPTIIDIAGFTRISENGIQNAIELSGLAVKGWTAKKVFTEENKPFMSLYVELDKNELAKKAISSELIKELLSTFFKYIDQDYRDLKKLLGMDPLEVQVVKCGTFDKYFAVNGKPISKMNPTQYQIDDLLKLQSDLH